MYASSTPSFWRIAIFSAISFIGIFSVFGSLLISVSFDALKEKGCSFSAGQYFEVKIEYVELTPEEFDTKMTEYTDALKELFAEGDRLQQEILQQLKKVRYE